MSTLPQFGVFMLAYSIGIVAGIVVGVGAPTRVLRAEADHQSTPGALYVVHTTSVVASFAACAVAYFALAPHPAAYAGLLLALGDTLVNFAVAHMTAEERHTIANVLVLFHRLVILVAVAFAYVLTKRTDFSTLSMFSCIPILTALVVPALFISMTESVRQWRSSFRGGAGYWAYSMSALVGQLQTPVLAAATSASVVATYTMAARVVGPISIVTASVSVIAVPELVKRLGEPPRFDRLFRRLVGLSVAYFGIVLLAAWPIAQFVVWAVGPQYATAKPIVVGMVIGAGISGCSQSFNSRLLALGRPFASSAAITAGALIALAMLASLGALGAVNVLWLVPIATEIVVVAAISIVSFNVHLSAPRGLTT